MSERQYPMPTQEERLDTVEFDLRQFKTETVRAYQDMALEITVIKGLAEDSIRRLSTLSDTMEKRFDGVDRRLQRVDTHLHTMDTHPTRENTHRPTTATNPSPQATLCDTK